MSTPPKIGSLDALARHRWHRHATFITRLAALRRVTQREIDRLPNHYPHIPRVRATTKISLDELALVLPPREKRILDHLRAKKPPATCIGQAKSDSKGQLITPHLRNEMEVYDVRIT